MFKAMSKKEGGFTLVELMVVVLIIGILVAIAVPIYNNASKKAKENTCAANIRTIESAITQYEATNDGAVPTQAQLTGTYIKTWPKCSVKSTALYSIDTTGNVVHNHN